MKRRREEEGGWIDGKMAISAVGSGWLGLGNGSGNMGMVRGQEGIFNQNSRKPRFKKTKKNFFLEKNIFKNFKKFSESMEIYKKFFKNS